MFGIASSSTISKVSTFLSTYEKSQHCLFNCPYYAFSRKIVRTQNVFAPTLSTIPIGIALIGAGIFAREGKPAGMSKTINLTQARTSPSHRSMSRFLTEGDIFPISKIGRDASSKRKRLYGPLFRHAIRRWQKSPGPVTPSRH